MRKQVMVYSKLNCKECGNYFMVPRKRAKRREEGHIKDLYCVKCKKTTKHIEDNRSETEKFWEEFHSNREYQKN